MDNQKVDEQERHLVDFLLAEHRYLGDCFWRNEEIGERRVNFFITLVTAAITALVALATKQGNLRKDEVYFLTVFALLALLSFGIVTLLRMIHRNIVTDGYKEAMKMIRSRFRDWDDKKRLKDYYPFKSGKARKLGTGGLVDMVALVNSVIVTALSALFAFSYPDWNIWLVALLGLITAWTGIFIYLRNRYDKERPMTKLTEIFSLGRGRLVQVVALVISLILLTALYALLAYFHPGLGIVLSGLLGFIAALLVQFIYVKHRYDEERPTPDEVEFPGD